jgi:hypothetical protein
VPIGLYESQDVHHIGLRGFRDEAGDLLRGFAKSLQQCLVANHPFFWRIHHVDYYLGSTPEIFKFLFSCFLLFCHVLDLLQALSELHFGIFKLLRHKLHVICMTVQQILHVSQQIFFISYYIIEFCGQATRRSTCASSDTNTWIHQNKAKQLTVCDLGDFWPEPCSCLEDFESPSSRARPPGCAPVSKC